jgi:hypothetical protein
MCISIRVNVFLYMYACIYVNICRHVFLYLCIHSRIYMYVYKHTYLRLYSCFCFYVYTYMCTYWFVLVCIVFLYVHTYVCSKKNMLLSIDLCIYVDGNLSTCTEMRSGAQNLKWRIASCLHANACFLHVYTHGT